MDLIDVIYYLAIIISGTVFGSFFTLAVHRIPKHQDITHERSYCPNCNHKLQFPDLIPVFSYIFLGGKCRYCGQKIRPRYLILEICSGLLFLLLALHNGLTYLSSVEEWIYFFLEILFLVSVIITAGIDKELKEINNGVMLYGSAIGVLNLIARFIFGKEIFTLAFGFFAITILYFVFYLIFKNKKEDIHKYFLQNVRFIANFALFCGLIPTAFSLVVASVLSLIYFAFKKHQKIPLGFILAISFAIALLIY